MSSGLYLGSQPVRDVYLGQRQITNLFLGQRQVYQTNGDAFNFAGFLNDWIMDLVSASQAGLGDNINAIISDGQGNLVNYQNQIKGIIAAYTPKIDTSGKNFGVILSQIPQEIQAALCAGNDALGNFLTGLFSDGLVGFLNGLPIIGGWFQWLEGVFASPDPLGQITSLWGTIPINATMAKYMGILQDELTGNTSDPFNFIVNAAGDVLAALTCGKYRLQGSSSTVPITYPIGSIGNMVQMLVPDGLVGLGTQTSRSRYQDPTIVDDGYVEAIAGSTGDKGLYTQVFRRYSSDGSSSAGVGLELMDSTVSIVRRVASVDAIIKPNVCAFARGDKLRLHESGDTHTVYRNGNQVGQWVDSVGSAHVGAQYRSIAMVMQASKELLGPRRYSPMLANMTWS